MNKNKVLWVTNRPIAAAERKFNVKATSGTWMEPTLVLLSKREDIELYVATVAPVNEVVCFSEKNVTYYLLPKDKKSIYRYNSKKHIEQWEKVIGEIKPDLLVQWGTEYAHGLCALKIANKMNIPSVIEIQGILSSVDRFYLGSMTKEELRCAYTFRNFIKRDHIYRQQKLYRKKAKIEKEMINCSKNVILDNSWAEVYCKAICKDVTIHNCTIDISKVFFEHHWNAEKCEKHAMFCSAPSGYPLKGLHQLVRAVAVIAEKYPDVKLYVPGMKNPMNVSFKERIKRDGYTKFLIKLIKDLDVEKNIAFIGRQEPAGMAEYMEKAEVVVVPSAIENHSSTLREAMLVGTPCVASYIGGIPETIEHGEDGFLYRFEEYEHAAYFIEKLFEDKNLKEKFSEKSREKMSNYLNVDKSTEAQVQIYNRIINKQE